MEEAHYISLLIDRLLQREGGYVDHPADRGGPTNFGITQETLSTHRGYDVEASDVAALTVMEAREIYHDLYWIKSNFFSLGLGPIVNEMLFDTAVHSGPGRATRLLQNAIGVKADGIIGPVTVECAQRLGPQRVAALFMGERVEYLGRIISKDHSQAAFASGWLSRMREFIVQIPLA
jgi:lysozyme family protein